MKHVSYWIACCRSDDAVLKDLYPAECYYGSLHDVFLSWNHWARPSVPGSKRARSLEDNNPSRKRGWGKLASRDVDPVRTIPPPFAFDLGEETGFVICLFFLNWVLPERKRSKLVHTHEFYTVSVASTAVVMYCSTARFFTSSTSDYRINIFDIGDL